MDKTIDKALVIIHHYGPGKAVVKADGTIEWGGPEPEPTDEEIQLWWNEYLISNTKSDKIQELDAACNAQILSGFNSEALGETHHYSGEYENQINIMGAAMSGVDLDYVCTDEYGLKEKRPHTSNQMYQVFAHGLAYKDEQITKFNNLRKQVEEEACDTVEKIDSIVW